MTETFTEEERRILKPFVTNLDQPVFALRNLPEVVRGALFSRYSRSMKSLRRVLLDEFILDKESGFKHIVAWSGGKEASGKADAGGPSASGRSAGAGGGGSGASDQIIAVQKAEEFYDRVLVGYGDDSVAELGGAHLAIEEVSNIATKVLEDSRIGLSPLEKSTRYVYFHEKEDGKYKYYREPVLMQSRFAEAYEEACDVLFDRYSKMIAPLSKYLQEKFAREEGVSDRAYAASLRAKTCDILRGLLPAATLTNMGMYGNGRAFEYLLMKMYASELQEVRSVARKMQEELRKVIPAFVKRADDEYGKKGQAYLRKAREELGKEAEKILGRGKKAETAYPEVSLADFDEKAEEKIVAALLYSHTRQSLQEIRDAVRQMGSAGRRKLVQLAWRHRENRRHKMPRAFENAYYTFDLCANFGAYRDLQRHRVLTQERQLLSTRHGYDTPKELEDAGLQNDYHEAMQQAKETFEQLVSLYPTEAQYVVPLAYRLRWYVTLNAREAVHLIELRSMPQGHPDYRRVARKMHSEIRSVHPAIAEAMKFIHLEGVGLERLEAEKRTDKKLEEIHKKYGGRQ